MREKKCVISDPVTSAGAQSSLSHSQMSGMGRIKTAAEKRDSHKSSFEVLVFLLIT